MAQPNLLLAAPSADGRSKETSMERDYDFFKDNGYLSLGKILSDDEVTRFADLFDRNRRDFDRFWTDNGTWQTQHCESLLTAPEFDELIRHPKAIEPLKGLMGDEVCFSEISLRHMGPYAGEPLPGMTSWEGSVGRRWHRDSGDLVWPEHPLRICYVQMMVYLEDVDDTTHSFAVSPQSIDQEMLDTEAQLECGGIHDQHGVAGTAILFNLSRVHTVTVRPTQSERKTAQIYYGHRHRDYLSESTYIPTRLWRDHPDEEVRGFYGVLNGKTLEYLERTAARDEVPVNEVLEILADIGKNVNLPRKYGPRWRYNVRGTRRKRKESW